MENRVEFHLQSDDDETIVEEFAGFFAPFVTPHASKGDKRAAEDFPEPIGIHLTIVGGWAAGRFVLDLLADRAADWWKSIVSARKKFKTVRSFSIHVKFQQGEDALEIGVFNVCDEEVFKQVWEYVRTAHRAAEGAPKQGIALDKVRIYSGGIHGLLAMGFERMYRKCVINLEDGSLLFPVPSPTDEALDAQGELYNLEPPAFWLMWARTLVASGYVVPEREILEMERVLEKLKADLKPR